MRRLGYSTRNNSLLICLLLFCFLAVASCNYIVAQNRIRAPLKQIPDRYAPILSPFASAFPPAHPLLCPLQKPPVSPLAFVRAKGTQLTYQGLPLKLYGYTFYPDVIGGATAWRQPEFPRYIDHILDMGAAAGQNMIRPTDFWDRNYRTNQQENAIIWKNLDYLVCAAQRRGVFVNMDVSAFAWFLLSNGYAAFDAANWSAFLSAVGIHYSLQPVIALYSILGEPAAPKTLAQMNALVNFYRATTTVLHIADSNHHLITAGGFNHMEDENPALPWWRSIYALPSNDIGAFKIYSQRDLDFTATIAAYGKTIDKPILNEEFGLPQNMGDAFYSGANYNNVRMSRAAFFDAVYTRGEALSVAGFIFWNLGCVLKTAGYDISPKTPTVWQMIKKHAPRIPDGSINEAALC